MKVAFSIATLATLALAYSVFFNDGVCNSKKQCDLTPASVVAKADKCGSGCCSAKADEMSLVSLQDDETAGEAKSCCAAKSCCSESMVALKQDGECSSSCSAGKSCCQDAATTTVALKQDGDCPSSCSAGKSCCQDGECPSGKCPATGAMVSTEKASQDECTEGKTCCMTDAMKKLPAMTYKVGTESTCCAHSAAQMAEKTSEAIHYVVAEKEFSCKEAAFTALVETTETYVNAFITPSKCEASGNTSVCEKSFACCQSAAKHTELVVNATKDIKVGYQVGDKSACCPNGAKALAAKENASIEYVVNGQKTPCELQARMMAAQAKYAAAVKAIASAETTTSTETTKSETTSSTSVDG